MKLPTFDDIALEHIDQHVLLVTLNRPQARNAFTTQMGLDLHQLWSQLTAEPEQIRCVILTGAGDQAFCAGADLKQRDGMSKEDWRRQHEIFERAFWSLADLPLPVIAAVNGHAYAGGLELVLCCDFAYAVTGARCALTEVTLGIIPGGGGTQHLPRAIGSRRAKEIIFTGRPFTTEQGYEWGLFNQLVEPGQAVDVALETARRIAANAPLAVRQAKKSMRYGNQMDISSAYRFEIEAYNQLVDTEDRREGIRAFNEKRRADFTGR